MRYYHLSKNCNDLIPQEYCSEQGRFCGDINLFKPSGFYFAKDDQWIKKKNEFISDHESNKEGKTIIMTDEEMSKIPKGYCLYRVFFKPKTNFFRIFTFEDLLNFNSQFKDGKKYPEWDKVKEQYDGILVENYWEICQRAHNELKFDQYVWFYTLDVDGGVIWNFDKIQLYKVDTNLFNLFFHERKNLKKIRKNLLEEINMIDDILKSF